MNHHLIWQDCGATTDLDEWLLSPEEYVVSASVGHTVKEANKKSGKACQK